MGKTARMSVDQIRSDREIERWETRPEYDLWTEHHDRRFGEMPSNEGRRQIVWIAARNDPAADMYMFQCASTKEEGAAGMTEALVFLALVAIFGWPGFWTLLPRKKQERDIMEIYEEVRREMEAGRSPSSGREHVWLATRDDRGSDMGM